MKPEHFIYKSDGLYYMQNVPEKPEYPIEYGSQSTAHGDDVRREWEDYYESLERSKAEAYIQCPKDGDLFRKVLIAHGMLQEGSMYTINMEEKIEVYEGMTDGWVPSYNDPDNSGCSKPAEPCFYARIAAPKKEEESEHQWNIWREAIEIPEKMRGMEDYEVIQELEKHFEIKRKPL